MCLAIPGKIVELPAERPSSPSSRSPASAARSTSTCSSDEPLQSGDWVLIHVGFAMSKISETRRRSRCACSPCSARTRPAMEELDGYEFAAAGSGRVDLMKFVDEFRDPELIRQAADEIRRLADPDRHYRIMEVCGGHTHAIYRFGLKDLLPREHRADPRPGLPGLRAADGPHRRRAGDGRAAGRDLHRLRRHDARARHATAARSSTRRAAPTCASSTRRSTRSSSRGPIPTGTWCSSPSASRPRRRRRR